MLKHSRLFSRNAAVLLAVLLLLEPMAVFAQEQEEPVTHIAKATVALKVRRAPDKGASGSDSIPRGSFVYIIEYGTEWCRVRTDRTEGYIMTKYLADVQEQAAAAEVEARREEAVAAIPAGELQPGFMPILRQPRHHRFEGRSKGDRPTTYRRAGGEPKTILRQAWRHHIQRWRAYRAGTSANSAMQAIEGGGHSYLHRHEWLDMERVGRGVILDCRFGIARCEGAQPVAASSPDRAQQRADSPHGGVA